jgi:phosphate-selective porin OprO/OprP
MLTAAGSSRARAQATTTPSFADLTTAAEEATAWAVGFNWYLNQNVKLVLDYEHTTFEGGGDGTAASPGDRENEQVLLSRLQLYF